MKILGGLYTTGGGHTQPLGDTAAKKGGDAKTDDRKSIRSEVSLRVGEFLGFD